jgi:hypothetical protein
MANASYWGIAYVLHRKNRLLLHESSFSCLLLHPKKHDTRGTYHTQTSRSAAAPGNPYMVPATSFNASSTE